MADCFTQRKKLSLDEVVAGVVQCDEDQELSDFEESESEIGDFEDEKRNQRLLVTSQVAITFLHRVDRETLLDDDDDANENDYVDNEVSAHCLQGYILSQTNFPRDINNIYYPKLISQET